MKTRHWLHASGFTLVELVVCIAILGILAAIGVPSYLEWIQNSQIRTAAEAMASGFRLARLEAVRRNTPVTLTLGTGTSWSIQCVTGCGTIQSRSASNEASVSIASANTTFQFNTMGRMTTPANSTFLDFSSTTLPTAKTMRVALDTGGNALVCDPAILTPGDTRRCP